jgi:hypothetical protein
MLPVFSNSILIRVVMRYPLRKKKTVTNSGAGALSIPACPRNTTVIASARIPLSEGISTPPLDPRVEGALLLGVVNVLTAVGIERGYVSNFDIGNRLVPNLPRRRAARVVRRCLPMQAGDQIEPHSFCHTDEMVSTTASAAERGAPSR